MARRVYIVLNLRNFKWLLIQSWFCQWGFCNRSFASLLLMDDYWTSDNTRRVLFGKVIYKLLTSQPSILRLVKLGRRKKKFSRLRSWPLPRIGKYLDQSPWPLGGPVAVTLFLTKQSEMLSALCVFSNPPSPSLSEAKLRRSINMKCMCEESQNLRNWGDSIHFTCRALYGVTGDASWGMEDAL